MTQRDVLKELKAMGTAQNRKVYARHGVGDKMYGVSFADLKSLKKRINVDHNLAVRLWGTKNHDARVLATMVADPQKMTAGEADSWARELSNSIVTDSFAGLVSQAPFAKKKMEQWSKRKGEWIARSGWRLLAYHAMRDLTLPDSLFGDYIKTIERDIHSQKNRVREAMNSALIAIGMRSPKLEKAAIAAAKRIGKVEVDHGETNCKTPDAIDYIRRAVARKRAQ